ncbi:MAG TPA: sigma-70 family RNA polymerase sigma factor [Gammaproteobacteria bacterium]|nr:sigma-70 family RNA polymerase sigma factor [Gammaproteobacteria bacterium]
MELIINNLSIKDTAESGMANTNPKANENLLAKVASGNPEAFEELINKYGNLIWSIARRYLSNQNEAEDAVQEIFVALWQSAGRFDPNKASEITFISMITRRRLIDNLRKNNKHKVLKSIEDSLSDDVFSQKSNLEENAEISLVIRALKKLDIQDQELLSLSIYQGYSHLEIAKLLNLPLGTVKTKIRRNLMKIRDDIKRINTKVKHLYHG